MVVLGNDVVRKRTLRVATDCRVRLRTTNIRTMTTPNACTDSNRT